MMIETWHTLVYQPLYNVLIFIINALPGHSVGVAIILLTFGVKLILYPLSGKSIKAQHDMRLLEPELKRIREEFKNDKQLQAKKTMELYQKHHVNPFSGCLPVLIQIPIIIGLYWVFLKGLSINTELLYDFVGAPSFLDMHFLVFDLSAKSISLALLAGISQYIQTNIALPKAISEPKDPKNSSLQEDIAKSMHIQMRYILPVMIGFIAYQSAAAVALYWTISNILSIAQEYYVRYHKVRKAQA